MYVNFTVFFVVVFNVFFKIFINPVPLNYAHLRSRSDDISPKFKT